MLTSMADLIVHRPKTILVCIFLLTAFFASHARHIDYDSTLESLIPQDDPEQTYYAEVRELFGSDEGGAIGLITDDVYQTRGLREDQ